jgi:Fe-Mn family superoxide dismutase
MKDQAKDSRRSFLRKSALTVAGAVSLTSLSWADGIAGAPEVLAELLPGDDGPFKLPPLPYTYNALEPYIDARTMEIHYTKHHQGYVDKLNAAMAGAPDQKGKSVEQLLTALNSLPDQIRTQVRNQGGGHWNHSFFWQLLAPKTQMQSPTGRLAEAIASQWRSFDNFKAEFNKAGVALFGSGWVWLVTDKNGKLGIVTTPNQDNTLMDVVTDKGKPVMGVDVWEHAYYLKHQNKRANYLEEVWNVINWMKAMELYG